MSVEFPYQEIVLSDNLKEQLDKPCWFHGTEQRFDRWKYPPPPKPGEGLLVTHTPVFFTSNLDFAKAAGSNIAKVVVSSKSKILDATENYEASERLRRIVLENEIASLTLNVSHDNWHNGWKTGDVMRMAYNSPILEIHLQNMTANLSNETGLSHEIASKMIGHNTARGLIELICVSAKGLGFDALYGYEIDRHTIPGKDIAQPWLAVFKRGVVTEPEWL